MKMTILAAVLSCAAPLWAQNDSGTPTQSPGPQSSPAPNLNTGGNPALPAAPSSRMPTYPSSLGGPAWHGQTIGGPGPAPQEEDDSAAGRDKRARDRRNPEAGGAPAPSGIVEEVVSPASPAPEPNPGALQGGAQP